MKKTILTIIQILVTVGILFWVIPRIRGANAGRCSRSRHPKPLAGWWRASRATGWSNCSRRSDGTSCCGCRDVKLPPWRVGALLMLGIFFNMFMPGGTGGDVLKIFFLLKEIPKKKAEGLLAVLMDRLIGLLALIMISSVIIGIQYNWLRTDAGLAAA